MYSTALIYSVLHSTLEFILLQSCWSERQMVGEVRADLVICTANCLFLSNTLIKCFPRYGNFPTVIVNGTTQHVITSFPPTLPPPIFFLSFSFSPPPPSLPTFHPFSSPDMDGNSQQDVMIIDKDESSDSAYHVVDGFIIEDSKSPFPVSPSQQLFMFFT